MKMSWLIGVVVVGTLALIPPCRGGPKEGEPTSPEGSRYDALRKEADAYWGRKDYVINENQIEKNAKKTDSTPYERRIYLKLPLYGVPYHWVFQEKAKLLAGNLTLTIKQAGETKTFVIFHDGVMSDDWEILDCCAKGPDEMYFGFSSKKTYQVSERDAVQLHLSTTADVKGIGPKTTGVLRKGDYDTFTQFKIFHLGKATGEKDPWAFLSNDGWNVLWKLEVTSNQGWMK